jgi:hypothetical protein
VASLALKAVMKAMKAPEPAVKAAAIHPAPA